MKRFLIPLLMAVLVLAGQSAEGKTLRAYLNYAFFLIPGDGPFIETYLMVDGSSVAYKEVEPGRFKGVVEVTMIFRQGEKIVEYDKYELSSPGVADTSSIMIDFIDQQRYFIPEGDYELEISIADMNGDRLPYQATQPITIAFAKDEVAFSGIELLESFQPTAEQSILTKGDYDLVPMISNFFPESKSRLAYYAEIYGTEKFFGTGEKFLVTNYITSFETGQTLQSFVKNKKMEAREVLPVLMEYDISQLPSGNYLLVIEAHDKTNKLVAKTEMFFQRSNPNLPFRIEELATLQVENTFAYQISNPDTLAEYIRCLAPIATQMEKFFIYKQMPGSDLKTRQQFFYNFWSQRNEVDPQQAWFDYYVQVRIADSEFRTQIQKGYETDRGRVFLQYGPPNIISESHHEPSSYPYEIWQYYQLGENQRNKRFVFYAYDLITNNFKLLHSDAIGEISNYRWQVYLNNRWYDPYDIDQSQPPDIWGGKADDYYRNPR
jgi:GWxTD domain-containing protein